MSNDNKSHEVKQVKKIEIAEVLINQAVLLQRSKGNKK